MKGKKKGSQKHEQDPFNESCPTPKQLIIKGLADTVSGLMQIPSEADSAEKALPLAKLLCRCIEAMDNRYVINPPVRRED